jgi:hypothetical protein
VDVCIVGIASNNDAVAQFGAFGHVRHHHPSKRRRRRQSPCVVLLAFGLLRTATTHSGMIYLRGRCQATDMN